MWYAIRVSHKTLIMGDRGRVVIPADTRERLGLEPGDRLALVEREGELRLLPLRARIRALQGAWAQVGEGRDLVDELIAERRAAADRE